MSFADDAITEVNRLFKENLALQQRAEKAEAERDVLLEILVTQVQLHRQRHPDLAKRACQTCKIYRWLEQTDSFKRAHGRLFAELLKAIETGNFIACPDPEDQPDEGDCAAADHDQVPL